jgi:hypothetical protein
MPICMLPSARCGAGEWDRGGGEKGRSNQPGCWWWTEIWPWSTCGRLVGDDTAGLRDLWERYQPQMGITSPAPSISLGAGMARPGDP